MVEQVEGSGAHQIHSMLIDDVATSDLYKSFGGNPADNN